MGWEYITGFFDADGTITFLRLHKNCERSPVISFSNNEYDLLVEIEKFIKLETGHNGFICTKKSGDFTNYELRYTYLPKCINVLSYINSRHPKKRRRIDMILNELKSITPRNGKYTKETLSKRQEFTSRFFS